MVTKNQLRIQLFNVLHGDVLSAKTIEILSEKLSEEELGALISMLLDNLDSLYQDLKSGDKFNDCDWLVDIAHKYNQVLHSLNVNFITQDLYINHLDKILAYLALRQQRSDVGCKKIFDSVYTYIRMLRCRCDLAEISVLSQEYNMLLHIVKYSDPELNVLVMSLLCAFSFDDKHIALVENFLSAKREVVSSYLNAAFVTSVKRNFIF